MSSKIRQRVLFLATLFVLACFPAAPVFAEADYWPTESWRTSTPEKQGIDSARLLEMMEYIKKNRYPIESVLVVRNGYIVLDAYLYPFQKGMKHIIHSCTKSITSSLVGIALDKGYIKSVDQPVVEFFPEFEPANMDERKKALTLKHLLTMTTGLECRDSSLYGWAGLNRMIESPDWARFVLDLPMESAPGEKFEYCNGSSYLLAAIIQKTTGRRAFDLAREHLFTPLGIQDVEWKANSQGIDYGWGKMWLRPHDMAKIGWLYLNKGAWAGKQIVPAGWVDDSVKIHTQARTNMGYGYQWWVSETGIYAAVGHAGQYIMVAPGKNMVVVFTADLPRRDTIVPSELLQEYIIPASWSSEPLPENKESQADLNSMIVKLAEGPKNGYIWKLEKEGVAREGTFTRQAAPPFKFHYPLGSRKKPLTAPGQVMAMKSPSGMVFQAAVVDISPGLELSDFGPLGFATQLKGIGSDVQVTSNEPIELKDGSQAYQTKIEWMFEGRLRLKTNLVSAYKDGKCVFLTAHPWQDEDEAASIVETLTFD